MLTLNVKLEAMEMQDKIKKILQEYYPYCDDEDLSKELLDLHSVSVSSLSFYDRLFLMMKQEYSELTKYEFDDLVKVLIYRHEKKKQAKELNSH